MLSHFKKLGYLFLVLVAKPVIDAGGAVVMQYALEWAAIDSLTTVEWHCLVNGWVKEAVDTALSYLSTNSDSIIQQINNACTDISNYGAFFAAIVAAGIVGWLCSLFYNRIKKLAQGAIESISETLARKYFTDEKNISKCKKIVKKSLSVAIEIFCIVAVAGVCGVVAAAVGFFLLPVAVATAPVVAAVGIVGGVAGAIVYVATKK